MSWKPANEPPRLEPTEPGVEPVGQVEVDAKGTLVDGRPYAGKSIYHKARLPAKCWWEGPLLGSITHWKNPRVLWQA